MFNKKPSPENVELTKEEFEALFLRIDGSDLDEKDKRLVKGSLRSTVWLRKALENGKLTIHKLKHLLFGFSSEKRKNKAKDGDDKDSEKAPLPAPSNENIPSNSEEDEKPKPKGHGRLGAEAYPDAEKVEVSHATLKSGSPCPEDCGGRLYNIDPGVFIRVKGQNMAKVVNYQMEKLRCALCGLVVTADLPKDVNKDQGKYDFRFKALLAAQKYFGGVPFFRQEHFQEMLGFPLPDSTQWDLIEQVADAIHPVIGALEEVAANGELIHNDDTNVSIVEVIRANKEDPTRERTGMFTSTFFARAGPREIVLYYSGTKHAGENLAGILKKRGSSLSSIIHMSDALPANLAKEFAHIILKALCLAHGRRYFVEIEAFFPKECGHVINEIGKVYLHDKQARDKGLSDDERLIHHQKYSEPVMDALKKWFDEQIEHNLVEPNSVLGKAIGYMRNHWEGMTLFLRKAGVPLDNNVCERMIKLAIRLRKNSLIHRTCHGARIASILMSVIQTCRLSGVNPIEYLIACQENRKALFKNPANWLPWAYQENFKEIVQEKAA